MKNEPLKGKVWCDKCGKPVVETISLKDVRSAVMGLKLCFVHNYSPHLEKCQVCGKNADVFFAKPIPNSIPPMQELPEMCLNCWIDKWLKCWDD